MHGSRVGFARTICNIELNILELDLRLWHVPIGIYIFSMTRGHARLIYKFFNKCTAKD